MENSHNFGSNKICFLTFKDNTFASHYMRGISPFAEGGESILVIKLQCSVTAL